MIFAELFKERLNNKLTKACENGDLDLAKEAIQEGADVNVEFKNGITPLHLAVYCGKLVIVKFFVRNGANVNAKSKRGTTPLHIAVYGHLDITNFLVENGADLYAEADGAYTPRDLALRDGYIQIAEYLKQAMKEAA